MEQGAVDAALVVQVLLIAPQVSAELLAGHGLAGPREQKFEHLQGLRAHLDRDAAVCQVGRRSVELESSEAKMPRGRQ